MPKRTPRTLTFDPAQLTNLRALSAVTLVPQSRLVDRALEDYTRKRLDALSPADRAAYVAAGGTIPTP